MFYFLFPPSPLNMLDLCKYYSISCTPAQMKLNMEYNIYKEGILTSLIHSYMDP